MLRGKLQKESTKNKNDEHESEGEKQWKSRNENGVEGN